MSDTRRWINAIVAVPIFLLLLPLIAVAFASLLVCDLMMSSACRRDGR